jgi:hypothetical protein
LFLLEDPFNSKALRLKTIGESDALARDETMGLFRGELPVERALQLEGYMGGQPADVL